MKCNVCYCEDEDKFELQDGVLNCLNCYSEIQGTREESTYFGTVDEAKAIRNYKAVKFTRKERRTDTDWTPTIEIYNIIICKQVSALINLGASEKLKDVVLDIWSRYLQKCGGVLQPDEQGHDVSVHAKTRYATKSQSKKKQKEENSKKKAESSKLFNASVSDDDDAPPGFSISEELSMSNENRMSDEENEIVSDKENEIHELSDEEIGIDENRMSDEENEIVSDKENEIHDELSDEEIGIDDEVNSSHAQKKKSTCGSTTRKILRVDYMTIDKTLCFCYLGILYTGDQLLLSDLIRFICEGRIPYLDVIRRFLPSMKLRRRAPPLTQSIPELLEISSMCAKLIDFIELPKFKQRSLIPIVFRFAKDLNLPDNIVHILKILLDKRSLNDDWYETKTRGKCYLHIPLYDVQAMASIIIVLKMILVLDGKYELEHSKVMNKINILLKDRKLFVWNKWKEQASLIESLFMKPVLTYSNFPGDEIRQFQSPVAMEDLNRWGSKFEEGVDNGLTVQDVIWS